jgi:hypothetical protein
MSFVSSGFRGRRRDGPGRTWIDLVGLRTLEIRE